MKIGGVAVVGLALLSGGVNTWYMSIKATRRRPAPPPPPFPSFPPPSPFPFNYLCPVSREWIT